MEEFTEEYKGVEFVKFLEIFILKLLSFNTNIKWVKFLFFIFIFLFEYGLFETDGQFRVLCGFKSKREMVRIQSWCIRFNKVLRFNLKCTDWYHD